MGGGRQQCQPMANCDGCTYLQTVTLSLSSLGRGAGTTCWLLPTETAVPTPDLCTLTHTLGNCALQSVGRWQTALVGCWTGQGLRHADLDTCAWSGLLASLEAARPATGSGGCPEQPRI